MGLSSAATVVAFPNQKGGATKTTTTSAFAAGLSKKGHKVLCVDLDQQGSLSFILGADPSHPGSFELLTSKDTEAMRTVQTPRCGYCDLISADSRLVSAEIVLQSTIARESILKQRLSEIEGYDYILIDTPPALSVMMLNALVAADQVVIPTGASVLDAKGMTDLLATIRSVKSQLNDGLEISGIAITKFRSNVKGHNELVEQLGHIIERSGMGTHIFDSHVRLSCVIEDAQRMGEDIFSFRPDAPAVADYIALIDEYLSVAA